MNDKKICFIICTNSNTYMQECLFYLNHLNIPAGYEVEVLTVLEAKSMTAGYNEGMTASDAKYKIYLHQDVFILNLNFIKDIITIFESDVETGIIGMIGPEKIPPNAIMWSESLQMRGTVYGRGGNIPVGDYQTYTYSLKEDGVIETAMVDGLLIATQYDLRWREDIFDGWDFYDASQCAEFQRKGYKVVVPVQREAWCLHDDGRILSMWNYRKYRELYRKEYMQTEREREKSIIVLDSKQFSYHSEIADNLKLMLEEEHKKVLLYDLKKMRLEEVFRGITNENVETVWMLDMLGFDRKTETGTLQYNILTCKMIPVLFGIKERYIQYFGEKLSLAMFFLIEGADGKAINKLKDRYSYLLHVYPLMNHSFEAFKESYAQIKDEAFLR